MKEYIDAQMLNELTEKQKQKLANWYKQYKGTNMYAVNIKDSDLKLPLLSIGQIIELLHSYTCDVLIESAGQHWFVEVICVTFNDTELINALWKALKFTWLNEVNC